VQGMLIAGQPAILGGPFKSLKTSLAADLAVSVAAGKPFLGHAVVKPGPVLFFSGESGFAALLLSLLRAARAKGIANPTTLPLSFFPKVPRLDTDADLKRLEVLVRHHRPALVIVDPCYRAMPTVTGGDVFRMGAVLGRFQEVCSVSPATVGLLVHHSSHD